MPEQSIQDTIHKLKSTEKLEGLLSNNNQGFYNPFLMLLVSYETKLKILEGTIDKYAKKIVSLKKDVKHSVETQSKLIVSLEDKAEQLETDKEEMGKNCGEPYDDLTIRDYNQHILALQKRNNHLVEEIDNCNAMKALKNEEISKLQEQIEHLELNNDDSHKYAEEIDVRLAERQKADLETELAQLEEKLIALRNKRLLVETEAFERQRESEALNFRLRALEKERQSEVAKIAARKEKLEAKHRNTKQEYEALCKRYREHLEAIGNKKTLIEKLNQELVAKGDKIAYLKKLKSDLIGGVEATACDIKSEQNNRAQVMEQIRKRK